LYRYTTGTKNELVSETEQKLHRIAATSRAFFFRMGYWPETMADLTNKHDKIIFLPGTSESYFIDAWGNPFEYEPFDLEYDSGVVISYGKDGQPGGKKLNHDLKMEFGRKTLGWLE